MDDAVCLRPVPYSATMSHDRALVGVILYEVIFKLKALIGRVDGEFSF
jgi:hypothetical protein